MNAFFREMDAYHTPTSFRQIIEQIGVGLKLYRLAVLINQLIGIPVNLHFPNAIGYRPVGRNDRIILIRLSVAIVVLGKTIRAEKHKKR